MVHFDHILSTFPSHLHAKSLFLINESLLSISPACCGQLVKKLVTLELHGIFLIKFLISIHFNTDTDRL